MSVSERVLQRAAEELKVITKADFMIIEPNGRIVAHTEDTLPVVPDLDMFISGQAIKHESDGYQYFKTLEAGALIYIAAVKGVGAKYGIYGKILAAQLQTLFAAGKERMDTESFVKNLLLGNVLPSDIPVLAKQLRISSLRRSVYLIKTSYDEEQMVYDILKNMFPQRNKDFITMIDIDSIVLVKETQLDDDNGEVFAKMIYDTISAEAMSRVRIAAGPPVMCLAEVVYSYNEARKALAVSNMFEPEKTIVISAKLGIGRIIYHLPNDVCEQFLCEVLPQSISREVDDELINTVNVFYENNLNVSETARNLYIHRNTLVYRLDKLQKLTGLDIRRFTDAVLLNAAFMVKRLLDERAVKG